MEEQFQALRKFLRHCTDEIGWIVRGMFSEGVFVYFVAILISGIPIAFIFSEFSSMGRPELGLLKWRNELIFVGCCALFIALFEYRALNFVRHKLVFPVFIIAASVSLAISFLLLSLNDGDFVDRFVKVYPPYPVRNSLVKAAIEHTDIFFLIAVLLGATMPFMHGYRLARNAERGGVGYDL